MIIKSRNPAHHTGFLLIRNIKIVDTTTNDLYDPPHCTICPCPGKGDKAPGKEPWV